MLSVWVTAVLLRLFREVVRFRVVSAVVIVGVVRVEVAKEAVVIVALLVGGPNAGAKLLDVDGLPSSISKRIVTGLPSTAVITFDMRNSSLLLCLRVNHRCPWTPGGCLVTHNSDHRSVFATLVPASDAKSKTGNIVLSFMPVNVSFEKLIRRQKQRLSKSF